MEALHLWADVAKLVWTAGVNTLAAVVTVAILALVAFGLASTLYYLIGARIIRWAAERAEARENWKGPSGP